MRNRHDIVMKVFSTISSPVFSELAIILGGDEIADLPSDVTFFETLRTMKEVRPFKLVFLLDALSPAREEEARRRLVGALVWADVEGLLDFIDPPPITLDHLSCKPWPQYGLGDTVELKDSSVT